MLISPPRRKSPTQRIRLVLAVAALALAALTLPVIVGVALVIGVAIRKPILASRHCPRSSPSQIGLRNRTVTRANLAAGIGLVVVGGVQGLGALALGWSITNTGGFAARTGFALAAEVVIAVTIGYYLKSRRALA